MATSATAEQKTLFCRMIEKGRDPQLCMKFMALWMWLESNYKEFEQLVKKLSSSSDDFIASVLKEADVVLSPLDLWSSKLSNDSISSHEMKNTLSLAQSSVSINEIMGDKAKLYKGIMNVYKEVCCVVFKEVLEERKAKVSSDEEKKEKSGPSKLNPFAKAWSFADDRAPVQERCLFFTFSHGFPLTENQIFRFFIRKYGKCVERVYVHGAAELRKAQSESTSEARDLPCLFGKIIFNKSSIPAMVLRGHDHVKFFVDQKPLWCKKFEPKRKSKSVVSA